MAEIAWHSREPGQVLKDLDVSPDRGLSKEEVGKRIIEYGLNELKKEKGISPFVLFLNQFKNILVIILLVAIVFSALVGETLDALVIGAIVVLVAVLGFTQEYRAERALGALKKMLSPAITVLREGKEEEVLTNELVPGDILLLEAGDRIPADARLIEAYAIKCDEASLTGESAPVSKDTAVVPEDTPVNDRRNILFTGTAMTYGRGKAIVVSTGMNTELGKIAKEAVSVETEKTPLEKRTAEIGKWLGIAAISVCFVVVIVGILREVTGGGNLDFDFVITMVVFAVALAVAAVPEALPAIVTGALTIGMRQMAHNNALVRKMSAVETLGCTTVICTDKTGTLTRGEMTVRTIFTTGTRIDVTGVGYAPQGEFKGENIAAIQSSKNFRLLLLSGILCNDATLEEIDRKWMIKGDPTEGSLIVAAVKAGFHQKEERLHYPRVDEIPFSSERKRMTTFHRTENNKRLAFMKGALEVVLERCSYILDGDRIRELDSTEKTELLKTSEEMALSALRVLGFAYKDNLENTSPDESAETDMVFLGMMGMMDPPRPEAIAAVKTCIEVGIKPVMITGDHKLTAVAVAKEIGIFHEGDLVLTGIELESISEVELEKIVDKVTVYARIPPLEKLKIVKAWKARGEVVAMTGDGVNDAPALKQADIGIAMGITGTEVAKEAADMVLRDDNFATIVKAIERGRWIYDNIKKYLTYLLRSNVIEVVIIGGIVMILGPEHLPLLPAAILYINLATDGLPALALGVAPPDPDIMQRPPRNPKESVFSRDVIAFILLALIVEIPFFYFLFFRDLVDINNARTEMFFLFIIIELIIALNFRSMKYSVLKVRPHKWLILAIIWELALITGLVHIPAVRDAFGINIPSVSDIGIILGFGVVVFVAMEIVKAILRRTRVEK